MSRGRGESGEEIGLRSNTGHADLQAMIRQNPSAFRRAWAQLPLLSRLEFEWPQNLSYLDLSDFDLMGLDLRGRDFSYTDLRGADLRGCLLDGARFFQAQLSCSRFDDNLLGNISLGLGLSQEELILLQEPEFTDYLDDSSHMVRVHNLRDRGYKIEKFEKGSSVFRQKTIYTKEAPEISETTGRISLENLVPHRDPNDGPAEIEYYPSSNSKLAELYCVDGKPHRVGAPAYQKWNKRRLLIVREFCENGLLHRDGDLPASEEWYGNGGKRLAAYIVRGEKHRGQGRPSTLIRSKNGQVVVEEYHENGKLHRDHLVGPALTHRFEDGTVQKMEFAKAGKYHRPRRFGPAVVELDKKGNLTKVEVWEKGKKKKLPEPYKFKIDGKEYEYTQPPRVWARSISLDGLMSTLESEILERERAHKERIEASRERKNKKKPKKTSRQRKRK